MQERERATNHAEGEYIQLVGGHYSGLGLLADAEKLSRQAFRSRSGEVLCPLNHTLGRCHDPNCCLQHDEVVPARFWSPAWHELMMLYQGHRDLEGRLEEGRVESLMDEAQRTGLLLLGQEQKRECLLFNLQNRLANCRSATGEPMSLDPIQKGHTMVHEKRIWGEEAPFAMGSKSGIPVLEWVRLVFGKQDALQQFLLLDVGEVVKGIKNCCQIKARAAGTSGDKWLAPHVPDLAPDAVLLQQVAVQLASQELRNLVLANPGSRLAQMWFSASEFDSQGFPDSLWGMVDPAMLKREHAYTVGQSQAEDAIPVHRLSLVGSDIDGELLYQKQTAEGIKSLKLSKDTHNCTVNVVVCTCGNDGTRHARSAIVGKHHTLKELLEKLYQTVKTGNGILIITGRGRVKSLAARKVQKPIKKRELQHAARRLARLASAVGPEPPPREPKSKLGTREEDQDQQLDRMARGGGRSQLGQNPGEKTDSKGHPSPQEASTESSPALTESEA